MNNEQHTWARGELEAVYLDAGHPVRKAVTALLSVWTRMDDELATEQRAEAVAAFSRLAQMTPLDKPVTEPWRVWAPAAQFITTGARYVRVLPDTIPDHERWKFDNRVAEVASLRHGMLNVTFLEPRDGAPGAYQAPVRSFEVDISHLTGSS